MKVYYNSTLARTILCKGYGTIMLFGAVFTKHAELTEDTVRHEAIHAAQYRECCILAALIWLIVSGVIHLFGGSLSAWWLAGVPLFYYGLYGVECGISYVYHMIRGDAREKLNDTVYYASAFEMEAHGHETDADYLRTRPLLAFIRYYGTL